MSESKELAPIKRTSGGLRDALFDEFEAFRRGDVNPAHANATAKLSASIVETVRLELDAARFTASMIGDANKHPKKTGLAQLEWT